MLDNSRVVAIIPARAGSKRLANKNLLPLAGKPLLVWTIEAALKCPFIDDVIVSTDSDDIKQVAVKFGATVPFLRPSYLADDMASTDDVLMHVIDELKLTALDILVLLQPTSPLRDSGDISDALSLLVDPVQGVVSVCECEHSPLWSNTLPVDLNMAGFIKNEVLTSRSQDLAQYYRLNGAIYAYQVGFLMQHKMRCYSDYVRASIMPVEHSVDIDSAFDFLFADFLMKKNEFIF